MAAATARIQAWTWILVYVGIVMLALGLSVQRSDAVLGWGIALPGVALITAGIVLIWVRSRIKDTKETTP